MRLVQWTALAMVLFPLLAMLIHSARGLSPQGSPAAPAPRGLSGVDVHCLGRESHAQWQEDLQIISWFFTEDGLFGRGVYFEIGAFDGTTYSNTYSLEKCLGWRGLLVEGSPTKAAQIPRHRSRATNAIMNKAVCKHDGGTVEFTADDSEVSGRAEFMSDQFMSSFHGGKVATIQVPCAPLSSIFTQNEIAHIDFWSLDVEGGELSVLETVDWSRIEISIIMLENAEDKETSATYPVIVDILKDAGYSQFGRCGPGNKPYKSEVWVSKLMAQGLEGRRSNNHRRCLGERKPTRGSFLTMQWDLQCFTRRHGEPAVTLSEVM
jgi:FkbM family methyltransferase